jgi:hypothetical protein
LRSALFEHSLDFDGQLNEFSLKGEYPDIEFNENDADALQELFSFSNSAPLALDQVYHLCDDDYEKSLGSSYLPDEVRLLEFEMIER